MLLTLRPSVKANQNAPLVSMENLSLGSHKRKLKELNAAGVNENEELEPVSLISRQDGVARKRRCLADVHSVLKDFEKYRPKVELGVDRLEQIVTDSGKKVEEFENALRFEQDHGLGHISIQPPGIVLIDSTARKTSSALNLLPLVTMTTVGDADMRIFKHLRYPMKCLQLVHQFHEFCHIIKDKHSFLDNLFLAMCLHSTSEVVEPLCCLLQSVIKGGCPNIDPQMTLWSPRYSSITAVLDCFGVQETYTELERTTPSPKQPSKEGEPEILCNIKALLDTLSCACEYRSQFSVDETVGLVCSLSKLSLDTSILSELREEFHSAVSLLISSLGNSGDPQLFARIEPVLCRKLLLLYNFHHNKLDLVSNIKPADETTENFRETLAYLSICQLVSGTDPVDLTGSALTVEWQMQSLCDQLDRADFSSTADHYLIYSLVQLFDIAVGTHIHPAEKDVLEHMKDRLSWSCSRMREHSMRPDVTTTKTLMYRVAMRWDSLILTATDIEERFDIIYKATPTKIMMVNSQEISIADIDGIPNSPKTVSDVEIKNEDTQWRTPLLEPTATDQDSKGKQPVHLHRSKVIKSSQNLMLKFDGALKIGEETYADLSSLTTNSPQCLTSELAFDLELGKPVSMSSQDNCDDHPSMPREIVRHPSDNYSHHNSEASLSDTLDEGESAACTYNAGSQQSSSGGGGAVLSCSILNSSEMELEVPIDLEIELMDTSTGDSVSLTGSEGGNISDELPDLD